ncbi:TRAP transporter small permease, partial [Peptostreptococcus anaerobius]
LAAIGVSVVVQVIGRQFGYAVDVTEFAGFCLAASTFLALAYTLRCGAHVRVTLLTDSLKSKAKRIIEIWVCSGAMVILVWLSWQAAKFTYQAYVFQDVSPGLMALPLWVPQTGMTIA